MANEAFELPVCGDNNQEHPSRHQVNRFAEYPSKKTPGKYQVLLRKLTSAVTQQSADDSVTTFATCRLTATVPSTIVTWSFTS